MRRMRDGRIEWMSAMANRLPMMIGGRIIGVPDEDIDQLMRWGYASGVKSPPAGMAELQFQSTR